MRRMIAIMFGAALAAVALHTIAPAQADPAAAQAPARVQLVIQRVHVLDDSDALTAGDLTYRFRLMRERAGCAGYWCSDGGAEAEFRLSVDMSADTGEVRTLNRVLGGGEGMALLPGDRVVVGIAGVEEDWDGPVVYLCSPPHPFGRFDDSLCGGSDPLGVAEERFAGPGFGIGAHSKTVYKDGRATFRVDYEIRPARPAPSATPRPSPTPSPRPAPGTPPRHEP